MSDTLARIKKQLEVRFGEDYELFENDTRLAAIARYLDTVGYDMSYPATAEDWEWLVDQLFDYTDFLIDRLVVRIQVEPQDNSESPLEPNP